MAQNLSEDEIVAIVTRRLDRGDYLSYMKADLGMTLNQLIELCKKHGIHYPNRHASDAQVKAIIAAVEQQGMTLRRAAIFVGISRSAAHRIISRRRNRIASSEGEFVPVRVSPYWCPKHGTMYLSPCIACEAIARGRAKMAARN